VGEIVRGDPLAGAGRTVGRARDTQGGRSEIDRSTLTAALERFRRDREEASFRALYREATPYLWAFARRLSGGGGDEAEELVQETWVRGVERLDRFRGEASFSSWLGGILLNVWRERRRELRWAADDDPVARLDEEPPLPDAASAIDLERALAELPDGARAVVLLHDLEGWTHEEIAGRLDIPAGTSKRRLFDARRRLRRRLGGGPGGTT